MKRPASARTRTTARGLTALEAVLLFLIVAAALALLAGRVEGVRTVLREHLATRQLALLQEATLVYFLNQGTFPPGCGDQSSAHTWHALGSAAPSAKVLAGWPTPGNLSADGPADPWQQPYRYLYHDGDSSHRSADNGGWPVFQSAGPDQEFGGMSEPARQVDNRSTDELTP